MDTIGGLRLVRRLGSGTRADVYLGHPSADVDGSPPRAAALKVFHPTTSTASIDAEIEALARLSSPFLISLRDLATADDGRPVLVLERLGPSTCSRLILQRERLSVGEAVTILAPMADAVEELERAGVAHGRMRLDRIGFDEVGTPVLFGFGHGQVTGPVAVETGPAERSSSLRSDGGIDDTVALAAVTRSVLETTRPSPRTTDLLDWVAAPFDDAARFRAELRDRLFELADPEAVVLTATRSSGPVRPVTRPVTAPADDAEKSTSPDWVDAMHLPGWVHDLLAGGDRPEVGTVAKRISSAIRGFLAPVRRSVWIAAASVAALLVAALVVTSMGDADQARAETADRSAPDGPSSVDEPADDGVDGAPTDPEGDEADSAAITGDDAALAGVALLHRRAECIAARSILCLDEVDQPDSAALDADSAVIRALQEGFSEEPLDLTQSSLAVTQDLGGSVILSLGLPTPSDGDAVPASLLLVRGDGGWRIRDLILG